MYEGKLDKAPGPWLQYPMLQGGKNYADDSTRYSHPQSWNCCIAASCGRKLGTLSDLTTKAQVMIIHTLDKMTGSDRLV